MFDSVLGRGPAARRRFGTGTIISIALHGGLLAGALWLTNRPVATRPPERRVVLFTAVPKPPPPPPAARPTVQPRPRPHLKPHTLVQPIHIEPPRDTKLEEPPPPEVDEGQVDGLPSDGTDVPGGVEGGEPEAPSGTAVVPFGLGMTRPVQLEGQNPQYTREALEAHVEGMMIARCVITALGNLENCRIIKGLPHMNEAVLGSLATRRYQPVTFQGHPVSVEYTFNIRLMLPGR